MFPFTPYTEVALRQNGRDKRVICRKLMKIYHHVILSRCLT